MKLNLNNIVRKKKKNLKPTKLWFDQSKIPKSAGRTKQHPCPPKIAEPVEEPREGQLTAHS